MKPPHKKVNMIKYVICIGLKLCVSLRNWPFLQTTSTNAVGWFLHNWIGKSFVEFPDLISFSSITERTVLLLTRYGYSLFGFFVLEVNNFYLRGMFIFIKSFLLQLLSKSENEWMIFGEYRNNISREKNTQIQNGRF